MKCERCGEDLVVGSWPFCHGGHAPATVCVIGDEIDLTIEHFGPRPERFRSRERLRHRMRELNVQHYVKHVGAPGSDKSKATTRWI